MLLLVLRVSAQGFFNLTADEVKIDSLLPRFSWSQELGPAYLDSVYTVSIDYPEFIDMHPTDVGRYHSICGGQSLPAMPDVECHVATQRKRGSLCVSFVPLVFRDGRYQKLVGFKLTVHSVPLNVAPSRGVVASRSASAVATRASAADRYAAHSVLASGRWVKISVAETGVHQLTDALVRQAGFSTPSKVKIFGYGGALQPEVLQGEYLSATDDLHEVPTCTVGGRRLFYANGPVSWSSSTATRRTRNPYSDYGYYFLTESDGDPLTVDSAHFVSSFYPSASDYHTLYEEDGFAWYHSGRNLYMTKALTVGADTRFELPAHTASGTLTVVLSYGGPCDVNVLVNDSLVGRMSQSAVMREYVKGGALVQTFAVDGKLTPSNSIVLRQTSGSEVHPDYVALTMDQPAPAPRLSTATFPVPKFVYGITNQDHHADPQADMVIIIPTTQQVLTQARRLKALHELEGLSVTIVPADELFNEFSSGTPDASAYRRYMKMLYDRAKSEADAPRYLLLFGDGSWDNRMLSTNWRSVSPDDYLLCFESENSFSQTDSYVCDDFYCMLDDGEGNSLQRYDLADVGVGRLPARTASEAKIMVDKILSYAANEYAGDWQNTICFLGDDMNGNRHMKDAEEGVAVVESISKAFNIKKIYWDVYSRTTTSSGNRYPDAARLAKQQMQSGALIMNYTGHGAAYQMSHERVLMRTDFETPTSLRLPLWITASCDITPFDSYEENIGETAMLNPKGGCVAFFGTTRTVYMGANMLMDCAFLKHVLSTVDGRLNTMGDAVRLSKNELRQNIKVDTQPTNKLHYVLLGDPALKLAVPTAHVVVDSINGSAPQNGLVHLTAGMPVTVKGHVEGHSDMRGVVTLTVRDVAQIVKCRLNAIDDETEEAFEFYDRPSTFFNGSDSVRGGQFTIHFMLPRDISYSEGTGLMTLYACGKDKTILGHGQNEGFTANRSADLDNDGIGPSVYCYLNSSSFVNGGQVNATPFFYAELTDKDGINTSGSSVGHDLELIIDGSATTTYTLNDFFQYDFGDYRSGRLGFTLPTLPDGEHTLTFRAWDILNNSSVAELKFQVVRGLAPQFFSVACTRNPATTSTQFVINHDRTGSDMKVEVEVYDTSGRMLWHHTEQGVPTDNTYTLDWDLCVDGGSRLRTGVYLYRVLISTDGSEKASQARKLIIL